MSKVIVKIKSYESSLADMAAKKIANTAEKESVKVIGPIPLPTKRERFTILKSVHVNKKSREQFEIRTHKRLVHLEKANESFLEKLTRLDLPAGIKIEIKTKK